MIYNVYVCAKRYFEKGEMHVSESEESNHEECVCLNMNANHVAYF